MPKISVIVPVYKVEYYLHRCVDSILTQTFTDFELILVDDGSPDNCPAICDEYKEKDSRVVVIHQENGGLSAARNAGIDWAFANSDSEWITFIDSDDWVDKDFLRIMLFACEKANFEISVCNIERREQYIPGEIVTHCFDSIKIQNVQDFFCENIKYSVSACGKLYKKKLFSSIRYPVGKIFEDEFVTHRILFQFEKIAHVDEPMYFYFINEHSITSRPWTTKRLDLIEGYEIELKYCKMNHLWAAFDAVGKKYVKELFYDLIEIEKLNNKRLLSEYYRKLRRCLFLHGKRWGYYPYANNDRVIYRKAFPSTMRVRYYVHKKHQHIMSVFRK